MPWNNEPFRCRILLKILYLRITYMELHVFTTTCLSAIFDNETQTGLFVPVTQNIPTLQIHNRYAVLNYKNEL